MMLAAACSGPLLDGPRQTAAYEVEWTSEPDPLVAGVEGAFKLQVLGSDGAPIQDLQQNHDRMVHTVFISRDLRTFVHRHHEDYAELTADDLRAARFRFPLTLPAAGDYLVAFDYAHRNLWLQSTSTLAVAGAPDQQPTPDVDVQPTQLVDDVLVALNWEADPVAGREARWTARVLDDEGAPVTDIVQYLGADGHSVFVTADSTWIAHTHAWVPGVENMSPSMDMEHVYDGPEIPFRYTFPTSGMYRMWVQFVRRPDPGHVYNASFAFEVAE
jgi:hypothetical protein